MVTAKLARVEGTAEADAAHQSSRLLEMCENLVAKHPFWSKARILSVFPEYMSVIDVVIDVDENI
jgi:hypothetical protein